MKKIFLHSVGCLAVSVALSGCATVFEGTSQDITVVSNPAGALCVFEREGIVVGRILSTPGTADIEKSKYDLTIRCNKPGFAEASYLNHSGTTATIAANIAVDLLFTAGVASIVDSADGADNKYDSAVNISMVPSTSPVASYTPDYYRNGNTPVAYAVQHAAAECSKEAIETARLARESGYIFKSAC
ncbi:MAG TPA: hypothetical protein VK641_09285 [Terriglobales bacterium]|nr:hypothetical protein [Terriglobales bacterium]